MAARAADDGEAWAAADEVVVTEILLGI